MKHNRKSKWPLFFIMLFVIAIIATVFIYVQNTGNKNYEQVPFKNQNPIFYQHEELEKGAIGKQESLKLPFSVIQNVIDPNIFYDDATQSVIITTNDKVMRMQTEQLTAMINEQPISLSFSVEIVDGEAYVPIQPLVDIYDIAILQYEQSDAVFIFKDGESIQWGEIGVHFKDATQLTPVRKEPSNESPIIVDGEKGQQVMILGEQKGWYQVQLKSGSIGFIDKDDVSLYDVEVIQRNADTLPSYVPWKPIDGKINVTWEYVNRVNPNVKDIPPMIGVNVISPTWFEVQDEQGNILNKADASYVQWAHENQMQVWALFKNNFRDPDMTSALLANYDARINMIKQLLTYVEMYDLQGINIDFENVYLKDKDNLTQFVRELTPFMHEQGAVVSIDVTIRGGSEMWSLFYDRERLGEVVDYMMVMTYDEHWASSPKAGSVASLPWVEKGITDIIKEDRVPPSKLLVGVPYYTRLWMEETIDGVTSVSSKTFSMTAAQNYIKEKNLEPIYDEQTKQNYVEHTEGNIVYKMWIEDAVSMKARAELVNKLDIAGIASWRRGLETQDVWEIIHTEIQ